MTTRLVVDASVVLKWQLIDEENTAQAVALRDDFIQTGGAEVLAPGLLLYEVANGVRMAVRRGRVSPSDAHDALTELWALGIRYLIPEPSRVLDLAFQFGLTAYDAAYLALAQEQGCPLWTADRSLFEASSSHLPWVRWLGDYPAEG